MKALAYSLLAVLILCSQKVFSQKLKINQAESYYQMHRFYDANSIYKELIEKDSLNVSDHDTLFRHAAITAENTKDLPFAYDVLKMLVKSQKSSPEDVYELFRIALLMNDYSLAKTCLNEASAQLLPQAKKEFLVSHKKGAIWDELRSNGTKDTVKLVNWNSGFGDFASAFYPFGLVVSSSLDQNARNWEQDNSRFISTYVFVDSLNQLRPLKFPGQDRHDGAACYDAKNHTWIYSKNFSLKSGEYARTGIYFFDESAKKESEFPFNSREYFVAQPYLSSKGDTLWFSSDMPGSFGKSDIWFSIRKSEVWSQPVNAGANVNTFEDDMFPVINGEELFYSTRGKPGLGGLDIFKVTVKDLDKNQPVHSGVEVNSSRDDFSLLLKKDGIHGFMSSNRQDLIDHIYSVKLNPLYFLYGAKLTIDHPVSVPLNQIPVVVKQNGIILDTLYADKDGQISFPAKVNQEYSFEIGNEETEPLKDLYTTIGKAKSDTVDRTLNLKSKYIPVSTVVVDDKTKEPVPNVEVTMVNITSGKKEVLKTDDKGNISTKLLRNADYEVIAQKQGFITSNIDLSTKLSSDNLDKTLPIQKIRKGAKFEVENVLYDFGKATLRPESKIELNKIVAFLTENPTIKVELSSHTDSRGSDKSNLTLSQKRAQSCVDYLISQGIPSKRIVAKGYGELQLLNKCKNGVTCDEADHQKNRRTEIKILSE